MELCGSILAANHAHLARDITAAQQAGITRFHIDVCDGHYTRDIIFGPQVVRDIRKETDAYMDVHLAVHNIDAICRTFLETGADLIQLQYETCEDPERLIDLIHRHGLDAGLSFVPATPVELIIPMLPLVERANLLSVNPGIGGQLFQNAALEKIAAVSSYVRTQGMQTQISVDGGIHAGNVCAVRDSGADIAILGSGIFNGPIENHVRRLIELVRTP